MLTRLSVLGASLVCVCVYAVGSSRGITVAIKDVFELLLYPEKSHVDDDKEDGHEVAAICKTRV